MDEAELSVVAVETVGTDAVAIDFESPAGFSAQPGQFVKLTLAVDGEDVSRFYTVSSPDVTDTFEITVEVDPDGDLAPHLADLSAGDSVRVSGPYGSDYYEGEDPVVVLAGGPGVGPAVAIAERAHDDGHGAVVVYRDADPIHGARIERLREQGVTVAVLDSNDELRAAVEAAGGDTGAAKIENFG